MSSPSGCSLSTDARFLGGDSPYILPPPFATLGSCSAPTPTHLSLSLYLALSVFGLKIVGS